jgi:hypothetical protein
MTYEEYWGYPEIKRRITANVLFVYYDKFGNYIFPIDDGKVEHDDLGMPRATNYTYSYVETNIPIIDENGNAVLPKSYTTVHSNKKSITIFGFTISIFNAILIILAIILIVKRK